jgi:hypothetical protein
VNFLKRLLGLELELSEFGNIEQWLFTNHKNIRYNVLYDLTVIPSGKELVLEPLAGDEFVKAMSAISKGIIINHAAVNNSCGLHVHVNALDYDYWTLRKLILMYIKLEPEIYSILCNSNRSFNEFCVPIYKISQQKTYGRLINAKSTKEIKYIINKVLYGININIQHTDVRIHSTKVVCSNNSYGNQYLVYRASKYGRTDNEDVSAQRVRYRGLNVHSWLYRGTLEFRMKEGTTDLSELINWPLFCGWLVEAAYRMKERELQKARELDLVSFSQEFMPRFITDWITERKDKTCAGSSDTPN